MKLSTNNLMSFAILFALLLSAIGIPALAQGHPQLTRPNSNGAAQTVVYLPLIKKPYDFSSKDPTTYVYVTYGEPETLDPALDYETAGVSVLFNVYDTLVFFDREDPNTFIPQLALEVPSTANGGISADGKAITFHIRPGIHFHDGSLLTASDVAYTFQRGLLQGGSGSPQWLLAEPLLGVGIFDAAVLVDPFLVDDPAGLAAANPAVLKAACQTITSAITADEVAGTVTFHLAQPWVPFIATLAQPWGSIQSKAWVSRNGGWDGNCDTWQLYYGKNSDELNATPLGSSTMGTGPYKLDHWTPGEEVVLRANESYWRSTPAWPGGPVGAPKLKTVVIKAVSEFNTRYAMLKAGDADSIVADSSADYAELDSMVGEVCDSNGNCQPASVPASPLRSFLGLQNTYRSDLFLTWNISTDGGNSLIGSGQLDGNGVPPTFFSDLHVRRAFAYCFNYDSFLNDALGGSAVRSLNVMLPGMIGYEENSPFYGYDPAKCEQEFKASTLVGIAGKSLWDTGFRLSIAYNTGNIQRQKIAEILQQELSAVNPNFKIEAVGLDWADYLTRQRDRKLPVFTNSWVEDIHDPHNWVVPYTIGTYGSRQGLPDELKAQFEEIINRGVSEYDPAQRAAIYAQFNQLYYEQAPTILLFVSLSRHYEQRWIEGWYHNPVYFSSYYYTVSKH